ncbi:acid protease, partial [Suillus decipiens]
NDTDLVQRDGVDIPVESTQTYPCISVCFGIPPTCYNLIVDTGSAVTWVGADSDFPYIPTDTSQNTNQPIRQTYGDGGSFYAGMTLIVSVKMPIGAASELVGMKYDGLLGIGPKELTRGALLNAPDERFSTITDYLFEQGKIPQRLVSLYFQPSFQNQNEDDTGILTFGGVITNPTYDIGNIAYTTTTATPPSSHYWGIDQSITYGDTEILGTSAGLVDSGAPFIDITPDAFQKYQAATGANLDPRNNLLTITPEKYDALRPLDFHIGDQTYSLIRNAQIWPRHINYKINGVSDVTYLVMQRKLTGPGRNFILGYVFLQRFYSVYDTTRSRVGFATTVWTNSDNIN